MLARIIQTCLSRPTTLGFVIVEINAYVVEMKQIPKIVFSALLIALLSTVAGCRSDLQPNPGSVGMPSDAAVERAVLEYDPGNYFSAAQQEAILVNMVTYIYQRPKGATVHTRDNEAYRPYYVANAAKFQHVYHYRTDDGVDYYYLIRPAIKIEKSYRAVGGRFILGADLKTLQFEEIFNTPIMSQTALRKIGVTLFEEMIETGGVDKYISNHHYIEWPNHRLHYNLQDREWQYKH